MDQPIHLTQDEIVKAHKFHLQHFPNQNVPHIERSQTHSVEPSLNPQSDDLGYYEDGTRRTLTDEQIALFRHSEIQRLLVERRRRRDDEEEKSRQGGEHKYTRGKQQRAKASTPSRYDDDTTVHARNVVDELSYEEGGAGARDEQPKKFQWPVLGT